MRQSNIFSGTRTFKEFASFIFSDTRWPYNSDISGSKFIENFGEANVANGLYVSYTTLLVNVKLIQFMMIVLQMEKHWRSYQVNVS